MAIKKAVDTEAGTVTITFEDGTEFVATASEVPEETRAHLLLHGASQKLGDSYAGGKEIREKGLDVQEWAKGEVKRVWDNILQGLWTVRGEGGVRVTQLAQAVFDVYTAAGQKITLEQVAEKLSEMEKEDKAKLSKAPKIAARLATIKAEKAAAQAEAAAKAAGDDSEMPELKF